MRHVLLPTLLLFIFGSALAVPVDPNALDGVAAITTASIDGQSNTVFLILCTDGKVYDLSGSGPYGYAWSPNNGFNDVPIPVSEILDWTPMGFRTHSGLIYVSTRNDPQTKWRIVGQDQLIAPIPCQEPVPLTPESIGDIKSMFR